MYTVICSTKLYCVCCSAIVKVILAVFWGLFDFTVLRDTLTESRALREGAYYKGVFDKAGSNLTTSIPIQDQREAVLIYS